MEFSYAISEKDYLRAYKMAAKFRRPIVLKVILFWCFVVVCLMLLFAVIQRRSNPPQGPETEPEMVAEQAPVVQNSTGTILLKSAGPLIAIAGFWGILMFVWVPFLVKRQYRRDTNCHGTITVDIDPRKFALRSSTGTMLQSGWNAFTAWAEKDGIVLLRYPSRTAQILNVGGLTESEREELRDILAVALPAKSGAIAEPIRG